MLSSYLLSLHSLAIVWWISSWLAAQLSCILINKMVFTETDSCYNRAESILRRGLQSHLLLNLLKLSIFFILVAYKLIFLQATRRMLRMSTTTPTTTMTRSITTMTTPTPTPATRSSTPPATRRSSTRGIQSSCPR